MLPREATVLAVDARGRTADEVAAQIASGLGTGETTTAELLTMLRTTWQPRSSVVALVIDAVDEAVDPYRLIVELLAPVASAANRTRIRLLVGTRRGGGDDLLRLFGRSAVVLDLDAPPYLDVNDVQEYVRLTLLADDDPFAVTPYRERPEADRRLPEAKGCRGGFRS